LAVHRRWVHNNGRWVDRKNFIDTVDIPIIVMPTSVDQAVIAIQVTKLHIALFRIQFRVMVTELHIVLFQNQFQKRILINIYTLLLVTVINVIIFIIFCAIELYAAHMLAAHPDSTLTSEI
jgi:hypothetical protein